jgi:hypothetical protein
MLLILNIFYIIRWYLQNVFHQSQAQSNLFEIKACSTQKYVSMSQKGPAFFREPESFKKVQFQAQEICNICLTLEFEYKLFGLLNKLILILKYLFTYSSLRLEWILSRGSLWLNSVFCKVPEIAVNSQQQMMRHAIKVIRQSETKSNMSRKIRNNGYFNGPFIALAHTLRSDQYYGQILSLSRKPYYQGVGLVLSIIHYIALFPIYIWYIYQM